MGLANRWHEVARTYADVNLMMGDIVKVTPSSKMVGDMALSMVSAGLTVDDVVDPDREVAFPESVVAFFKGELGQPYGGFPVALQAKVLKGEPASSDRPGANKAPLDLAAERQRVESRVNRKISDEEFQSSLMYANVFAEYAKHRRQYGPLDVLPTPVFFYGMQAQQEISIDLEPGKRLVVRCQAIGEADGEGNRRVFFELNGQPRVIKVADKQRQQSVEKRPQADVNNPDHLASPMPGVVASIAVSEGQKVTAGDLLLTIEAMKMETAIHSERDGMIDKIAAPAGTQVDAKDLLIVFKS
jgi:pyruvate carboxylase